jgi:tetratricopeptide (TPR) repeat protein
VRRFFVAVAAAVVLVAGCGPAPADSGTVRAGADTGTVPAPVVPRAAAPGEVAPAPAAKPQDAQEDDPFAGRTYKQGLAFTATGDLLGDGRPLMVEVLAEKAHGWGLWPESIRLQVKGPGGAVLAAADVTVTEPTGLDLLDLAGDGKPFIILHTRQLAVSDHMAWVYVYRYDGQVLQQEGAFSGWYGGSSVIEWNGQPVASLRSLHNPALPFWSMDLACKPCAKPVRTQLIGWLDGRVNLVSDTLSRLAYPLYEKREFEKPLSQEAEALVRQAEQLLGAGRPAEAVPLLEQALALEPAYPDALNNLAFAYALQGQWEASREAAQKAVEWNAWHPYAQFNLGVALLELNKPTEAEVVLEAATALQYDRWETHYHLGLAYERQGKAADAKAEFQRALYLEPSQVDAQMALNRIGK